MTRRAFVVLILPLFLILLFQKSFGQGAKSPTLQSLEKVAILYLYPSDATDSDILTKEWLTSHFQEPITNFWKELSHNAYTPQITVFYQRIPLSKSFLSRSGHQHYIIDELNSSLPDNGNLVIPGYVPTSYDITQILMGGGIVGYGGGNNKKDIRVNGVSYPSQNLGSFTYDNSINSLFEFEYYAQGKPYRGTANGSASYYPDLGLIRGDGTLLHEWGHALGLSTHANYWRCEKEPFYGEIYCMNEKTFWKQSYDYGNRFDIMGGSPKYALHINAFYQDLIGWMQPQEKVTLSASQKDVQLMPLEGTAGEKRCAILPIAKGSLVRPEPFDATLDYSFYIEYRQPIGLDKHLGHDYLKSNTEGLMINLARRKGNEFILGALLDMSPDTIVFDKATSFVYPNTTYNDDDHHECTLNKGRTFYDEETQWTVSNVRANGLQGVLFDVEKGKKVGAKSGVYAVRLFDGEKLTNDSNIPFASENLTLLFIIQPDGNIAARKASDNSFVNGYTQLGIIIPGNPDIIELKEGNLIAYAKGNQVWESKTGGNPNSYATLDNDGIFRVYTSAGTALFPKPTTVAYSGGSGTQADPYQISTFDDLKKLSETPTDWSKHFMQTADIDASTSKDLNGGKGFQPIGLRSNAFLGSYNGNSKTIAGLVINRIGEDNTGLFGYVGNGASLSNIGVIDANVKGSFNVGVLVGNSSASLQNSVAIIINNCYTTGSVQGSGNYVGGLSGTTYASVKVSNAYTKVTVKGEGSLGFVGGLVGYAHLTSFSNCYALGNVNGTKNYVGGLIGRLVGSTLNTCYAVGKVQGNGATDGGLVGESISGSGVEKCYWDTETSGQTKSSGGAIGRTTAEMKMQATFAGWDFDNVWAMDPAMNDGYPSLRNMPNFRTLNNMITISADTLTAIEQKSGVSYQWYKNCKAEPKLIPGATNRTYTPTENDRYTERYMVEITLGTVTERSICIALSLPTEVSNNETAPFFRISPNPNSGTFTLSVPTEFVGKDVLIRNTLGAVIATVHLSGEQSTQIRENLPNGIYFLFVDGYASQFVVVGQ